MGEQNVRLNKDEGAHQAFMKALLAEVHALETMLSSGMLESGVRRIGAEQEMFLVDRARKPANKAREILAAIGDRRFTHELGLFNLEANLSPRKLGGDCLRQLETEAQWLYRRARETAAKFDCDIALVGILPTLTKANLGLDSMTPIPRYHALNDAICALRGKDFEFTINGIDQLSVKHDNVMLEACNTSFQVHFQVSPEHFARNYNIAQLITGPLLAAAANSPPACRPGSGPNLRCPLPGGLPPAGWWRRSPLKSASPTGWWWCRRARRRPFWRRCRSGCCGASARRREPGLKSSPCGRSGILRRNPPIGSIRRWGITAWNLHLGP